MPPEKSQVIKQINKLNTPTKKRNLKKQVKRVLTSFWFWISIFAITYFTLIFIFSLSEISRENNLNALIFYYVTQVLLVLVIDLMVIKRLSRLQRSQKKTYLKAIFLIFGIIIIILFNLIAIQNLGIIQNFEKTETVSQILEEQGYAVLYTDYSNKPVLGDIASVSMKSSENKKDQIWNGLSALNSIHPNADKYKIRIVSGARTCDYTILGDIYRAWLIGEFYNDLNPEELIAKEIINSPDWCR